MHPSTMGFTTPPTHNSQTKTTATDKPEHAIKKSMCSSSLLSSPVPSDHPHPSTGSDQCRQNKLKAKKTCLTKQQHTTNMSRKRKPAPPKEIPQEKRTCLPSTANHARLFSARPLKQTPMPPQQLREVVHQRFQMPNGACLYVYHPSDTYLRYGKVMSFDPQTGVYTLEDQLTTETFCRTLSPANTIMPTDSRYAHCTTTKDIGWLRQSLHAMLCETQDIQHNKGSNQSYQNQILLFHRRVHASLLFENINSLPGCTMSTQARCFNIALVCSLHEVVTKHSLCDTEFYLLCKNVHNHTTETTLKKFCFATIAFRIATGLNLKIDINTRGIKDLLYIDKDKYRHATTFLDFFANSFHPSYTNSFHNVRPGLEKYDLYRSKMNLVSKKRSPLYSGETTKGGAMHYNHFCLYDNLSSSFQKAFVNNALNVQGCPGTCNNNSPNERFPLLTTQQKQDMFHRCNQLWYIFETAW